MTEYRILKKQCYNEYGTPGQVFYNIQRKVTILFFFSMWKYEEYPDYDSTSRHTFSSYEKAEEFIKYKCSGGLTNVTSVIEYSEIYKCK